MKTMAISEFKTKCLSVLKEINRTNESLVITKHGKPFADVRPHKQKLGDVLDRLRASTRVTGDIVSPIDVEWDANR